MQVVCNGDDIDQAIRVLKQLVMKDGTLTKLRLRGQGWKQSIRRKNKEEIARTSSKQFPIAIHSIV